MGLEVIERSFRGGNRVGGDRIVGVIVDSSLRGIAVPRPVLCGNDAWAGLSMSLADDAGGLAGDAGGGWRGGRRTSIVVGAIFSGASCVARRGGSELGNSGARELISSIAEGIDEDAGVGILVGTRELDEFAWTGSSRLITANVDLDTAGVELSTSGLISQMKGNDLMTEEISTVGEGGRKLERMGLSINCKVWLTL